MLLPPNGRDWIPTNGQMFFLQLFSTIMARVLVGPELCANMQWHQTIGSYMLAGHAASQNVRDTYPPWLRWTAKYLNKDVKAIYAIRKQGEALLQPVIEARVAELRGRTKGQEPVHQDAVAWLVASYLADGKPANAEQILQDVCFLVAASVHGITLNGLSILFDLMDRPDSMAEMRGEISKVYAEHGSWTRQALGSLRFMDSFMKESQRVNTFQYCKNGVSSHDENRAHKLTASPQIQCNAERLKTTLSRMVSILRRARPSSCTAGSWVGIQTSTQTHRRLSPTAFYA
jgi:hypothetical protein